MAQISRPADVEPPESSAHRARQGPGPSDDERLRKTSVARQLLTKPGIGAIAGAIVVGLFFTFYTGQFATPIGVATWTDPASTFGIVSLAVALLMIGGEFDLSAGVMIGSTGLVTGLLTVELHVNIWLAMLASLVFAVLVGLFNGLMVTRTKLHSFIITLGTFFVLQGVNQGATKLVTNTVRVDGISSAPGYQVPFDILGSQVSLGGTKFQVALFWWFGLTAVMSWLLLRTKFGNWIFAVGGNPEAARSVGVPVARVKVTLFVMTSVSSWLVGMMTALRLTSVQASQGVGQELIFIVCAVVGGCLLTGGHGSAFGASVGALIFGMAEIGIPFAGWDGTWFFAFLGAMLLLAVLVNNIIRRRFQEGMT